MLTVEKNRVVSLVYELRTESFDGEIIETVDESNPLVFLYGRGNLLPKFEEQIKGLKKGDTFNFNIPCEDAYGEIDEEAVIDLPISIFEVDGEIDEDLLQPGNVIPMQDEAGNRIDGMVLEVSDTHVTMDFNHPLAGADLYFTGKITDVREATEEEIIHGHAHA